MMYDSKTEAHNTCGLDVLLNIKLLCNYSKILTTKIEFRHEYLIENYII